MTRADFLRFLELNPKIRKDYIFDDQMDDSKKRYYDMDHGEFYHFFYDSSGIWQSRGIKGLVGSKRKNEEIWKKKWCAIFVELPGGPQYGYMRFYEHEEEFFEAQYVAWTTDDNWKEEIIPLPERVNKE